MHRPKSLVLIGPSKVGKTVWARSLGLHSYFGMLFNVVDYNDKCDYAVFDDIDARYFPNYKGWLGAQPEFTFTGRYARNRTIRWSRPVIWCTNEDPRYIYNDKREPAPIWDRDWLEENCTFVTLHARLY